jgi:hypothetical protein
MSVRGRTERTRARCSGVGKIMHQSIGAFSFAASSIRYLKTIGEAPNPCNAILYLKLHPFQCIRTAKFLDAAGISLR